MKSSSTKNKVDVELHAAAASGAFRVREDGRIETNRKWNGHRDVEVPWHVCDRDDGKGYYYVSWHMARLKAHRLAYLLHNPGEDLWGMEVNHDDGNRKNNRKKNLEKCDAVRQSQHAYETGLNKARGVNHRLAKLTDADVRKMRALRVLGVPYAKLARDFGVTPRAAKLAVDGETWKHVN